MNVSIKKKQETSVSKDRRYTKLKKEVTGDFFLCAAAILLRPQQVRVMNTLCSYMADFFEP